MITPPALACRDASILLGRGFLVGTLSSVDLGLGSLLVVDTIVVLAAAAVKVCADGINPSRIGDVAVLAVLALALVLGVQELAVWAPTFLQRLRKQRFLEKVPLSVRRGVAFAELASIGRANVLGVPRRIFVGKESARDAEPWEVWESMRD